MSNTGCDELTSEPEVTEELITPLRNRPWRYIPQFTDEECRWFIVDRTNDEDQREEKEEKGQEGTNEGQGLLQYYRHKRTMASPDDLDYDDIEDMNGDLEVMELAKVMYGRPSHSTAIDEGHEVYEEPIVPVRIVRRTDDVDFGNDPEVESGLPGKLNGGTDGTTDPDGIWKSEVVESPVESEERQWKTSAVPPSTHLDHLCGEIPGETDASLSFADSVLKSFGISNDLEMENEGHENNLEPTGSSIFASHEVPPGSGELDLEWSEESKRPDVLEMAADPEENYEPKVEVVEELLVETRTVQQTRPLPVFTYTSENADGGNEEAAIFAETEAGDVTENVISGDTSLASRSVIEDAPERETEVHKEEASLNEGGVKVGPGSKGGTLPSFPPDSRTPPAKPPRARRTKSETFFGFIRRKSKSKERDGGGRGGEEGESDEKNEKKRAEVGGGGGEEEEKRSHSVRASPTTLRSKKSTGDEPRSQSKKTSFLQKLGFGRSSRKTEKQNPDERKSPDGEEAVEEKEGQRKEGRTDGKHLEAAKASTLPKQSSSGKKTNIRIFEIMGKNSHEEGSESTPDVSRTPPPPPPSSSSPHPPDSSSSSASVVRVDIVRDTVGSETGATPPLYSSQIGTERNSEQQSRDVLHDRKKQRMDGGVGGGGEEEEEERGVQVTDVGPGVVETGDALAAIFQKRNYIVAVAIDFGTAFSGYAFCFLRDPESIHMMGRWEDGDPGVINQKTPTTLLLSPEGKFHSFGFTARNSYHDLSAEEAKEWLYFDRFKMALYESQDFSETMTIEAANGKRFPGLDAISLALRFFRDHALAQISSQSETRILNDDVLWIVTVPAIWNASAKQMMRLAAYKAGLVSPDRPDQLQMALEPEAASVHIRRLQLRHLVPEKPVVRPLSVREEFVDAEELEFLAAQFNQVVRYMIVDSGGGTVDITVHEMNFMNRRLQELHVATGGPHGSFSIDRDFERLLELIFGPDLIQSFRRERPSGWIGLMMAFESRKRAADPRRTNPLNVALPFSFIEFHRKTKGTTVEEAIKAYGDSRIRWSSQGMLRLSQEAMRNLFSRTIDKIKQTIENVLGAVKGIDYIFLVGGLSESSVFQCEIRDHFAERVRKVVIPQEANLAVIKGALAFGLDPTVIAVRRSKLTYGAAVLNRFVHGKHPPSKLVARTGGGGGGGGVEGEDGAEWCRDVFDVFVGAGQVVRAGERVVRQYIPASPSQKRIVIGIYCTEDISPRFVSDPGVRKCGNVSLDLATTTTATTTDSRGVSGAAAAATARRRIQAELVFAETEIRVTATDILTQRKVNASIDFLNV